MTLAGKVEARIVWGDKSILLRLFPFLLLEFSQPTCKLKAIWRAAKAGKGKRADRLSESFDIFLRFRSHSGLLVRYFAVSVMFVDWAAGLLEDLFYLADLENSSEYVHTKHSLRLSQFTQRIGAHYPLISFLLLSWALLSINFLSYSNERRYRFHSNWLIDSLR